LQHEAVLKNAWIRTAKNRYRGLFEIHLSVIFLGATALFGKLIDQSPATIVLGRTFFASIALLVGWFFFRQSLRIRTIRDGLGIGLLGVILAGHWMAFFHSIQVSTVAIGLLTFATFPIFVTFLEPLMFKERIRRFDIIVSVVAAGGLFLLIPEFDLSNSMTLGVAWGMVTSVTCALLVVLCRKYVARYPAMTLTFYQNVVAALCVLPFAGHAVPNIGGNDLAQLLLLGVVFTAFTHTLYVQGLKNVKAQLASMITCLEPIYGITLAFFFLQEVLSWRELCGGAVVIAAVLLATTRIRK
jgi:drug/metabolite transporter (DMT)-like permease